jgi:hypothetical protein
MTEPLGITVPPKPHTTVLPVTARDMIGMLRRHYLPDDTRPAGVFAPEIQAPGPVQRRADLIWLGCTAATGTALVGHEVKVTRADLLTELQDLTKSDPWQRYCDQWWLVVPDLALIKGLDLPASWGVMLPPSGRRTRSMTVHRVAPVLHPGDQGPALRTLTAWQHWKLRDTRERIELLEKECQSLRNINHQLNLTQPVQQNPGSQVVARIVRELGGMWSGEEIGTWEQRVTVEDVVAALKDLGAVQCRRDEAQLALDRVRDGVTQYQRVLATTAEALTARPGDPR